MPDAGFVNIRNAPLLLCYVLFPLSNYLALVLGTELFRNWIDVAMLIIGGVALLSPRLYWRSTSEERAWLSVALLCLAGMAMATLGIVLGRAPAITALLEMKPLVYVLLMAMLTSRYGVPSDVSFCRAGVALAVLLIGETLLASLLSGGPTRPVGSGEVNYDAALLCVSLVFASTRRRLLRRYGWVIWLGIVASFSRTGLLASTIVVVATSAIGVGARFAMCVCAAIAVLMSFVIRGLEVGSVESLDRYWMWMAGAGYLLGDPLGTAFSATPGTPIDVSPPQFVSVLWEGQQEGLGIQGVFPFHFHAMWLRMAVGWGWLTSLVAVVGPLLWLAFESKRGAATRMMVIVIAVLGLTMGVIYQGNVAPIVILAFMRLLKQRLSAWVELVEPVLMPDVPKKTAGTYNGFSPT